MQTSTRIDSLRATPRVRLKELELPWERAFQYVYILSNMYTYDSIPADFGVSAKYAEKIRNVEPFVFKGSERSDHVASP